MASANSETVLPGSLKLLVAGGFGVGKTTLVGAVSDFDPLTTEAPITEPSRGVDDLFATPDKSTTTVAMDFGRISLSDESVEYVLYLFGTPGQRRFWFMWDDLCVGALGAVVLVDTRRLEESFEAIDFFESRGIPFVVAVNRFDGTLAYPVEEVRSALSMRPDVPVLVCDARRRGSVVEVLLRLLQYLLETEFNSARPVVAAHTVGGL